MEASTITQEFKDLLATHEFSPQLLQLRAYVQCDPVQSRGAINFTLGIHNRNPQQIEIPNPIDFVNFILQDERGFPLSTPPVVSRLKLPESDWETWENEFFKPVAIFLGEDELPASDEINKKVIVLPQEKTYYVTFQLSGLKQPGQDQGEEIVPVPPGIYHLTLTYSLLLANSTVKQNRLLQAEGLSIQVRDDE